MAKKAGLFYSSCRACGWPGISPGCADCHLPHEFVPKLMRKIVASKEVYGHLTGVIDTDEKYLLHREAIKIKAKELARLKANDPAECRYYHDVDAMNLLSAAENGQAYAFKNGKEKQDLYRLS